MGRFELRIPERSDNVLYPACRLAKLHILLHIMFTPQPRGWGNVDAC